MESRDLCLKKAEETVNFVKERGVTGTAKSATEGLLAAVQEAKEKIPSPGKAYSEVISRVESAWESFVTHPQGSLCGFFSAGASHCFVFRRDLS